MPLRNFRNKNVSWSLNRFAKLIPFREGSELQAGPSSFQHTYTHGCKLLFDIV
jgi:hypothetical protein